MKKLDLTNKVFGRLTVLKECKKKKYRLTTWECICSCGNKTKVVTSSLTTGKTSSCGCYKKEKFSLMYNKGCTINGKPIPEYSTWQNIKDRCYNPNNKYFSYYGGRGIKMCDEWKNNFFKFFEDMGHKPSPLHSMDRFPNNDGDYEKSNCRWATKHEQSRNMSRNKIIVYNGEEMIAADFAKKFNVTQSQLNYFIKKGTPINKIAKHFKKLYNA